MRHGEAGRSFPPVAGEFERQLTEGGRKKIEDSGKSLKDWKLDFDTILTSPLKRAEETANVIAAVLGMQNKLVKCDDLKPEGNRIELYKRLSRMRHQSSVLIVGHEPYLSTLIGDIISGNPKSHISLKKGGLAKIEISAFSPRISGELKWLLTSRQLRKI